MSLVKNDRDTLMQSKEQLDSLPNDEGSCGRSLASRSVVLKKGPWTSAEDAILVDYVKKHGEGNWNAVQKHSGLSRCGKSCRLRWANHLRPNLKKGVFTKEEEQMIIQMHAKIGNKWARMASLLPGRTDNEIKNYWNTRIKRRQRAGLPLYPPCVSIHVSNEIRKTQSTTEFSIGGKQNCGVSQGTTDEIRELGFAPYRANPESLVSLPGAPPFSNILDSGMLSEGLEAANYPIFSSPALGCFKSWESPNTSGYLGALEVPVFEQLSTEHSDSIYRNLRSSHLNNPDPYDKYVQSYGRSIPDSHALANGNFSASRNLLGTVKTELPSLQYAPNNYTNLLTYPSAPEKVDTFIQSPRYVSIQSGCASPISSGLLEALVHESQAISSGKKLPSEKCSSSSAITPSDKMESSTVNFSSSEWEETSDPNNHFCQSANSLLDECTPISGSSVDELPYCQASSVAMPTMGAVEPELSGGLPDFLGSDALRGLDWFIGASQAVKESSTMDDAIVALLAESPHGEQDDASVDPLGCCPWQNMPRVHQLPDTPKFS